MSHIIKFGNIRGKSMQFFCACSLCFRHLNPVSLTKILFERIKILSYAIFSLSIAAPSFLACNRYFILFCFVFIPLTLQVLPLTQHLNAFKSPSEISSQVSSSDSSEVSRSRIIPLMRKPHSEKYSMEGVLPVPGLALRLRLFPPPDKVLKLNSGWQVTRRMHHYCTVWQEKA